MANPHPLPVYLRPSYPVAVLTLLSYTSYNATLLVGAFFNHNVLFLTIFYFDHFRGPE